MSEANDPAPAPRRNPILWIALLVVGLILFVLMNRDRGDISPATSAPEVEQQTTTSTAEPVPAEDAELAGDANESDELAGTTDAGGIERIDPPPESDTDVNTGTIQRALLVPPGMRAREYIGQLREAGKPYPLSDVYDKAEIYRGEGSLADAHLLYFFAAKESHLPAMMMMAEMSDPDFFRAEDSLLDQADPIQAYKWYRKAAELGQSDAPDRLESLKAWAETAAAAGDAEARQMLLNFQ